MNQKGLINIIIIGVVVIIIAAAGYFALTRRTAEAPLTNQETQTTKEVTEISNNNLTKEQGSEVRAIPIKVWITDSNQTKEVAKIIEYDVDIIRLPGSMPGYIYVSASDYQIEQLKNKGYKIQIGWVMGD